MAVPIIAVANSNPINSSEPFRYFPRAVQSGVIDLDQLTEQISTSTTLTETDCQAVVYSLVHHISRALQDGNIVRLGHLGSFQISVKGTASETAEEVSTKNINSASIVYRPGPRFKKLLKNLEYKRKR
jgi:predicted histone-like DNA-binding protein